MNQGLLMIIIGGSVAVGFVIYKLLKKNKKVIDMKTLQKAGEKTSQKALKKFERVTKRRRKKR